MALAKCQQLMLKAFERTQKRSAKLVEAAQRAPELAPDPERPKSFLKPRGMTERDFRIAQDALQPSRNAPLYLTKAYDDYELAQKLAADAGDGAASKAARTLVVVVEKPRYERQVVERDDAETIEVEAKALPEAK